MQVKVKSGLIARKLANLSIKIFSIQVGFIQTNLFSQWKHAKNIMITYRTKTVQNLIFYEKKLIGGFLKKKDGMQCLFNLWLSSLAQGLPTIDYEFGILV